MAATEEHLSARADAVAERLEQRVRDIEHGMADIEQRGGSMGDLIAAVDGPDRSCCDRQPRTDRECRSHPGQWSSRSRPARQAVRSGIDQSVQRGERVMLEAKGTCSEIDVHQREVAGSLAKLAEAREKSSVAGGSDLANRAGHCPGRGVALAGRADGRSTRQYPPRRRRNARGHAAVDDGGEQPHDPARFPQRGRPQRAAPAHRGEPGGEKLDRPGHRVHRAPRANGRRYAADGRGYPRRGPPRNRRGPGRRAWNSTAGEAVWPGVLENVNKRDTKRTGTCRAVGRVDRGGQSTGQQGGPSDADAPARSTNTSWPPQTTPARSFEKLDASLHAGTNLADRLTRIAGEAGKTEEAVKTMLESGTHETRRAARLDGGCARRVTDPQEPQAARAGADRAAQ